MARVASAAVALYGLLTTCLASEAGRCDVGESQACPAIGQAALQRAAKVQDEGHDLIQIEEYTNIFTSGGNSPCPNFVAPPSLGFMTGLWTGRCRRNPQQDPTCAITRVAKISDQEFIAGYKDGRWFKMAKFNTDGNIKQTAKYYSGTPANAKDMVAKYSRSRKTGRYGDGYVFVKGVNFFNCSGEAPPLPPLLNQGKGCWSGCRRKQGPCNWCGTGGSCCRFGWRDKRNGCDGTLGIPRMGHVCTANPSMNQIPTTTTSTTTTTTSTTPSTTSTTPSTTTTTTTTQVPLPVSKYPGTQVWEICPAQLYTNKILCNDGTAVAQGECCPDTNSCPSGCASSGKSFAAGKASCICKGCPRKRKLQLSDADAYVKAHNYFRCLHGLPELEWDTTVASNARIAATQSVHELHELSKMTPQAGENIALGKSSAEHATAAWYNEITDPGYTPGTWGKQVLSAGTGHYTALIWKATRKLGCTNCSVGQGRQVWACQYSEEAPNSGNEAKWLQNVPQSTAPTGTPKSCCAKIYR